LLIQDVDKLSNKFKNKVNQDNDIIKENEQFYARKDEEAKAVKFDVNTLKSEVMILKNIAKPEMINLVNKSKDKIKFIEGQLVNI
jgi:broad-specificity NMP kinase